MSLTNPNKPVTEARLQEFYHRIKNYLGFAEMPSEDMEEIVTPKPSAKARYHKYSTEEQVIGEWIDGKPLYEKTISTTLPTIATDGTTADKAIDLGDLNIDYAEVISGSAYYADGSSWGIPINASWGAGTSGGKYFIRTQVNYTNTTHAISLILQANRIIYSNAPVYVTIRYTKSTD